MGRLPEAMEALSPEARKVLADGFAAGRPAAAILSAVADATGEEVALRTVQREAAKYRIVVDRRRLGQERMRDFVEAWRNGSADASEQIFAIAAKALEDDPDMLTNSDPVQLQRLALKAEELRVRREQVAVRGRELALDERRVKLLEEREQRAVAVMNVPDTEITPEERLVKVREILGLSKC